MWDYGSYVAYIMCEKIKGIHNDLEKLLKGLEHEEKMVLFGLENMQKP